MRTHHTTRAAFAVTFTLTLALGALPAAAQLAQPAELPPAGFEGVEYVDSAGCVFARVDVADRVEWVPRVGPDRQQLCGMDPSVPVVTATAEPTPAPVTEAVLPAPAAPPPVRTAARTATSRPAPPPPVMPQVTPVQVVPVQILLPDTVQADDVTVAAPCPDPASIAVQYLENSIVPGCSTAPPPSRALTHGSDHPRPRPTGSPVARLRVEHAEPPRGYQRAWTDGRLNPYRGIRTVEGENQMRMVWTDTVPRRLVPAE